MLCGNAEQKLTATMWRHIKLIMICLMLLESASEMRPVVIAVLEVGVELVLPVMPEHMLNLRAATIGSCSPRTNACLAIHGAFLVAMVARG